MKVSAPFKNAIQSYLEQRANMTNYSPAHTATH